MTLSERLKARFPILSDLSHGHAERPLIILIVGSFFLPFSVFLVAGWISYGQHFEAARENLVRSLGTVHEHAVKVFDTFEISSRYLDELTGDVTDEELRAHEADYSARIKNFIGGLPQIRDLWVVDAKARPLVSGTVFPMPRTLDLSDRDFFSAHLNGPPSLTFVSGVVDARAANVRFFAITRRRVSKDGRFDGVNLVSIAPEYFDAYYATLPGTAHSITTLIRSDGAVLAAYPNNNAPGGKLPPTAIVMRGIAENPKSGIVAGVSGIDSVSRIFAYRKIPKYNVYVVSGIETSQIVRAWMRTMSSHLLFGFPATATMIALGLIALSRTRRESNAFHRLRDEIDRRQLAEQALHQAQKMEAVGRLTGGIAHDFNNLLTAILGNVETALRRLKTDDPRIERSLKASLAAGQRATTLVQRLLAFSRQHLQEVKAVNINRVVQDMSEILHRTIGETIAVQTVLAAGLWRCAVDVNQLENAILNLAVNARDAMPNGGRLTIETANAFLDANYIARSDIDVPAGQYVMLAVSDTGSGIPPDIRDKVFEPFFTTKAQGAGSGLGLSMVYGFAKQSKGHIQLYSEPDQGTAFKIYFPRLRDESTLAEWEGVAVKKTDAAPPTRSEVILLVEDDNHVADFVREALADLGYRVEFAQNGPDALKILENNRDIALLLTDVILPGGMNGREIANRARAMRPEIRVLFATGYTHNAIFHHGRLDPDVDLITKPFTTDMIANKLDELLSRPIPESPDKDPSP